MIYELFINDIPIDLDKETVFALNFAIADLKNPEKREQSYSKDIKLPGTKHNNGFFSSAVDVHAYDRNESGVGFNYDPTVRYSARYYENGALIFNGVSNLVESIQKDGVYTYNIVLYSAMTNIIQGLGDIMISELGWSDYDHVLSVANIQSSWSSPVGSGYVYPYIDYGFAMNPRVVKTNELRPHVYLIEVFEKCLNHLDYTFSSVFLNTALIKKIIVGYGGGDPIDLSPSEVSERQTNYSGDGSKSYLNLPRVNPVNLSEWNYFYNIFEPIGDTADITMTLIDDDLVQFDGEQIIIANSGNYNLNVSCDLETNYAMNEAGFNIRFFVKLTFLKNGAWVNSQKLWVTSSVSGTTTLNFNLSQDFDLDSGDVLEMRFNINTLGTTSASDDDLDLSWDLNNTLSMNLTAINSGLVDGDTVQLARHIPKMKAADFVKDCITMFNLFIDQPDADNNLLIEDFDRFYFDTDEADNWTEKEDQGKDIKIRPAATIQGKTYSFKYAQDRDYYKNRYFEAYGIDYGDFDYNVPSTFKKGEKKYQLKIAQSVPVQLEGTDIIIPRILKFDEGTGVTSPHKGKTRIFFYNGTVSSDSWQLVNADTGVATTFTVYPLAHHLDSLTAPTIDLNFGRPEIVFYSATAYTSNNLFYNYHAELIRELTGRDSKIKTAYFDLDASDFYNGFLRNAVNINGSIWRKNKIIDYRATGNQTTKVELIKIIKPKANKNFETQLPQLPELPIDNVTAGDDPIIGDQVARADLTYYPVDTSGGDVTITLNPDFLRVGKAIEVKKVSSDSNKIIVDTSVPAFYTIDGNPEVWITGYNDSLTILWDGVKFNIV